MDECYVYLTQNTKQLGPLRPRGKTNRLGYCQNSHNSVSEKNYSGQGNDYGALRNSGVLIIWGISDVIVATLSTVASCSGTLIGSRVPSSSSGLVGEKSATFKWYRRVIDQREYRSGRYTYISVGRWTLDSHIDSMLDIKIQASGREERETFIRSELWPCAIHIR